jgi:hypothetical protein
MKKKILIIGMVLAMVLTGCGGTENGSSGNDTSDVKNAVLDFEKLDSESLSDELKAKIDESSAERGHMILNGNDGSTYLAVFLGEKPSSGYGVEIIKVENIDDKTVVTASESSPGPDEMNATIMTYPLDIVEVSNLNTEIKIVFEQIEPEFKYETIGEIIEFGNGVVHVLMGDIAGIYEIDNEMLDSFYIGETVGVQKTGDDKYTIESYIIDDFSTKYTNMGQMITTVEGTVKSVGEKNITISTDKKDLIFDLYKDMFFEPGKEVIVDYFKFDPESDKNILITIYDDSSKLKLAVNSIKRSDDGVMVLEARNGEALDYLVYISSKTVVNFNFSELSENDKITVYPEVIMESDPLQVESLMILK